MREPVPATPRAVMTKARRLRIYMACNGRCVCGVKVPMEGTTIDHALSLFKGGADTDDNLRFLCRACDKPKTAQDATDHAKLRRLIANEDPETRPVTKRPIRSRGFQKDGPKARLQSRPFPKRPEARP